MDKQSCYHCGDDCEQVSVTYDEKNFCCTGCKTVYEIFASNDLSYYYDLQESAGASPTDVEGKYDFLDTPTIVEKLSIVKRPLLVIYKS
jgi:Cu+-exporting ATPase